MVRRVRYVLIGVLYAVLALFVAVGFVGDLGLLDVPSLLIAALVIAFALLGSRWSDRRGERKRLVHEHGLSAYDARMAMHLVDSGQVMRTALRPAGRSYAQRQLDRGPTPVWVPALGVVMAVAVYLHGRCPTSRCDQHFSRPRMARTQHRARTTRHPGLRPAPPPVAHHHLIADNSPRPQQLAGPQWPALRRDYCVCLKPILEGTSRRRRPACPTGYDHRSGPPASRRVVALGH